jgi:anti-anti-sigma factor
VDIDIKKVKGWTIVKPSGKLNVFSSPIMEDKVKELLQKNDYNVGIDFGDISYIDSSGINVLIILHKEALFQQGQFFVYNVQKNVDKVFRLADMHQFLIVYDTEEDIPGR